MTDYTPATPPRALILCEDGRLSRLLETELTYLGVTARVVDHLPTIGGEALLSVYFGGLEGELCLLMADGDRFPLSDCEALAEACGCPLLAFGREDVTLPAERGVYLRRPFDLDRLEDAARSLLSPAAAPLWTLARANPRPEKPVETERSSSPVWEDGVLTVQGQPIPLTATEQAIFQCLYTRRGETVSREELSGLLGGGGNSVEVYVCKLRAKIEKPLGRRMIVTVRGVGYKMEI